MYGSVEQAFVGRDEPKNGCEGGYIIPAASSFCLFVSAIFRETLHSLAFILRISAVQSHYWRTKSSTVDNLYLSRKNCSCKRGLKINLDQRRRVAVNAVCQVSLL